MFQLPQRRITFLYSKVEIINFHSSTTPKSSFFWLWAFRIQSFNSYEKSTDRNRIVLEKIEIIFITLAVSECYFFLIIELSMLLFSCRSAAIEKNYKFVEKKYPFHTTREKYLEKYWTCILSVNCSASQRDELRKLLFFRACVVEQCFVTNNNFHFVQTIV